jgi:hypothetical protein
LAGLVWFPSPLFLFRCLLFLPCHIFLATFVPLHDPFYLSVIIRVNRCLPRGLFKFAEAVARQQQAEIRLKPSFASSATQSRVGYVLSGHLSRSHHEVS